MKLPNYYAVLPASVRYDGSLRPNAKLLYAEITALCCAKGYCCAQNEYFAQLYGVTRKTISELVGQLAAKGYINVEVLRDRKNQVTGRRIWLPEGCEETGYPIPKNQETSAEKPGEPIPKEAENGGEAGDPAPKKPESAGKAGDSMPKNRGTSTKKAGEPIPKNREDLIGGILQERINTPIAPMGAGGIWREFAGEDAELLQALLDFEQMRKRKRKPMTDRAKKMLLGKLEQLAGGSREAKIRMLEASILHCWDTVYAPKDEDGRPAGAGGKAGGLIEEDWV